MIRNTVLSPGMFYYPLGNSLPVSLTQDLPPEQDADILLLGCGDARNVLFTCFADVSRKIDVTCCDMVPGIHARNVLLYTLLLEDENNANVDKIWNIYYHWKLDEESVELLETQIQKLLNVSQSIDQWHDSGYGPIIRFCDERSLSVVRSYWLGFQLRGLSDSAKTDRLRQLQAAFDRAKALRDSEIGESHVASDFCASYPVVDADTDVAALLGDIARYWWNCGTTPSSTTSDLRATRLNPAFLYSPSGALTLNLGLSPIVGFPLCTAYNHFTEGHPFHQERKSAVSGECLVDCAKRHFKEWASAFRRVINNKSIVRIFCGDALAFCWTLRNVQLTMPACSRSMNLFSNYASNYLLELHHADYHNEENAAPTSFDIIDTSNLIDHLGPLNVIGICTSLLKFNIFSSLYTETFFPHKSLSDLFGVDPRAISLLFGLVLPDLFTNATDCFEDDLTMEKVADLSTNRARARSRLRWKRVRGCQASEKFTYMRVEAEALAKLLIRVHDMMFRYEDQTWIWSTCLGSNPTPLYQGNYSYNRASFALLLNLLKASVLSDWDECVNHIYDSCCSLNSGAPLKNYAQDLLLQMHLYGVDNGTFNKPVPDDVNNSILAPILRLRGSNDLPEQLCVTIQVSREKLKFFSGPPRGIPALVCIFEGGDPGDVPWKHTFSAVHITYGTSTWHEQTNAENSFLHIDEDSSELFGTSNMFVSVYVPTQLLLRPKRSVPWVMCGFSKTVENLRSFVLDLGPDLYFSRNMMTSQDVTVTRYMPGVFALPEFLLISAPPDTPTSASTTVCLTPDGSKVKRMIRRITLESHSAKAQLAIPSSAVEIDFKSPFTALVSIAKSHKFKCEFPVPVSPLKYKVRVARKSAYIEIETPLFDPLQEDASTFVFPIFMTKVPSGTTIPVPWTSTHIDLDAMPAIHLKGDELSWLGPHVCLMYSVREDNSRKNSKCQVDIRGGLKYKLGSIIMHYTNLQSDAGIFWMCNADKSFQMLIFLSCLRLDLVNHTVVLDTAMVPLTKNTLKDSRVFKFLNNLYTVPGTKQIKVSEGEIRAWKSMMPVLVERCRTSATWKHTPHCEYIQANEVPLSRGLSENNASSICSCGIGKFPSKGYLISQKKKLPDLIYLVNRYATRVTIAPIFINSYVEDSILKQISYDIEDDGENCENCGILWKAIGSKGEPGLSRCAKCKIAKYCSKRCQKIDWSVHKLSCTAA